MEFFIFLLCAALFIVLVVAGAVLFVRDLLGGKFSYEGSGYKPPNDEGRNHLDICQIGISMDPCVFHTEPDSELIGGRRAS